MIPPPSTAMEEEYVDWPEDPSPPQIHQPEILRNIFSYLPPSGLAPCLEVNSTFHELAGPILYRSVVLRDDVTSFFAEVEPPPSKYARPDKKPIKRRSKRELLQLVQRIELFRHEYCNTRASFHGVQALPRLKVLIVHVLNHPAVPLGFCTLEAEDRYEYGSDFSDVSEDPNIDWLADTVDDRGLARARAGEGIAGQPVGHAKAPLGPSHSDAAYIPEDCTLLEAIHADRIVYHYAHIYLDQSNVTFTWPHIERERNMFELASTRSNTITCLLPPDQRYLMASGADKTHCHPHLRLLLTHALPHAYAADYPPLEPENPDHEYEPKQVTFGQIVTFVTGIADVRQKLTVYLLDPIIEDEDEASERGSGYVWNTKSLHEAVQDVLSKRKDEGGKKQEYRVEVKSRQDYLLEGWTDEIDPAVLERWRRHHM